MSCHDGWSPWLELVGCLVKSRVERPGLGNFNVFLFSPTNLRFRAVNDGKSRISSGNGFSYCPSL